MTTDTRETLDCGHPPSPHSDFTTGYGTTADGGRHCYACCASHEREAMIESGQATLYLDRNRYLVTDWPGELRFKVRYIRTGRHNIARTRYDVDFTGPDGHVWHGTQYGDNTQIVHCRRTKARA